MSVHYKSHWHMFGGLKVEVVQPLWSLVQWLSCWCDVLLCSAWCAQSAALHVVCAVIVLCGWQHAHSAVVLCCGRQACGCGRSARRPTLCCWKQMHVQGSWFMADVRDSQCVAESVHGGAEMASLVRFLNLKRLFPGGEGS